MPVPPGGRVHFFWRSKRDEPVGAVERASNDCAAGAANCEWRRIVNLVFHLWLRRFFSMIILGLSLPVFSYELEGKKQKYDDCLTHSFIIEYRNPEENPSSSGLLRKIRDAINGEVTYNGRVLDTFHSYTRETCILRGEAEEVLQKLKRIKETQRVELNLPAYIHL